jgi:hypothetical protein
VGSQQAQRVDIYIHIDAGSDARLDQILASVNTLVSQGAKMDVDVQAIITEVAATKTVADSADTLLKTIFDLLTAALAGAGPLSAADRTALQQTVADLAASRAAQVAAIVANTPAAPTPAPTPAPAPAPAA